MCENNVKNKTSMYGSNMDNNSYFNIRISSPFFYNAMSIADINSVIGGLKSFYKRYTEGYIFYMDIVNEKTIDRHKIIYENAKPFIKNMVCIFPLLVYLECEVSKAKLATEIEGYSMIYYEKKREVYDKVNAMNCDLEGWHNRYMDMIYDLQYYGREYYINNMKYINEIKGCVIAEVGEVKKVLDGELEAASEIIKQCEDRPIIKLDASFVASIDGIRIVDYGQYAIWDEDEQIMCLNK
ncbi:MAG: hypothetical protein IJ661_08205 [Lachnospiraceae bacterium]|nr:hypothetical protein [Lachnospiraceae bacterium]